MGSRKDELRYDEYDPRKRKKRVLGWVIVSICAFVIIAGSVYLLLDNAQKSDTEKMYQQLSANTIVMQATDLPEIGHTSEAASIQDALMLMNGRSELTEEEQKTLEKEAVERNADSEDADLQVSQQLVTPDAVNSVSTGTRTSRMDFSNLLKQNTDTVAWLTIGNSVVNYPVVQGQDNQHYLSHRFDGEYSRAGTVFVDYRNTPDFQDQNTIIYGHYMGNGTMFCTILDYKKQEYYDQYPTMTLYTPNGDYIVAFFAGIIVPIRQKALPCFYMLFENDEAFSAYIADAKRRSTFQSTVDVRPGDRIVTICTCTYEVYNARYVLLGKLTPI
ncbi:MAG TPA: class B sortase [Candidatus Limiplasma sp.]|nr:class B sortase [Candidatus Limiplasma sp.]